MSLVDGPGNRTSIFFQGCNLNCFYCHNPETINICNNCGICVPECPSGALSIKEGKVLWDESICEGCDTCIKVCPYLSTPKVSYFTPEALRDKVKKSIPFIKGVTVSGGEATLQHAFLTEFFKLIHELNLTTFVDSNATVPLWDKPDFVKVSDAFMIDIKAFDKQHHIDVTGYENQVIIDNIVYLAKEKKLYELRTVCIDGMDNESTVRGISELLSQHDFAYRLIKYRPFGVREAFSRFRPPQAEEMKRLQAIAQSYGYREVTII